MAQRIEVGDAGWIDVSDSLNKRVMEYAIENNVTPATAYQDTLGLDINGDNAFDASGDSDDSDETESDE